MSPCAISHRPQSPAAGALLAVTARRNGAPPVASDLNDCGEPLRLLESLVALGFFPRKSRGLWVTCSSLLLFFFSFFFSFFFGPSFRGGSFFLRWLLTAGRSSAFFDILKTSFFEKTLIFKETKPLSNKGRIQQGPIGRSGFVQEKSFSSEIRDLQVRMRNYAF